MILFNLVIASSGLNVSFMANNYEGDVKDFARIVPLPVFLLATSGFGLPAATFAGAVLPTVLANFSGTNPLSGTQRFFAYTKSGNTFLFYDANGDITTGTDTRILAKLTGVTASTLDAGDFSFV